MKRFVSLVFAGLLCVTTSHAQVTQLIVNSSAGDYIGQGQQYTLTPVDGTFRMEVNHQNQNGVSLFYHDATYAMWWQIDFNGPNMQPLHVGPYPNAKRFPFNGTSPGFDAFCSGRGCNSLTGSFEIRELMYDSLGQVSTFWATASQRCEGFMPPLQLEIMYNLPLATATKSRSWGQLKSIYR